ncbi:LOW QUALITY PROTEIN: leucine-rich repeat-containing protein 14-like [Trichechus inunguis]
MHSHPHTTFLATAFLIFLGWQHRLRGSLVATSVLRRKHLLQAHRPLSLSLHSCPQNPLESLVISECRLTRNDIAGLFTSIHTSCLKELVLSNNNLSQIVPGPLEFLLGVVSGTLQHLNLRNCGLEEFQLRTLLPALCHCSHLCFLLLVDNVITTLGLTYMLQLSLKEAKHVHYPVPNECVMYLDDSRSRIFNRVELAWVHATLQGMLQALQWKDMELTNSTSTD